MNLLQSLAYLVASVLFIVGLTLLSSPRSARRGNFLGALGMLIAIVTTLLDQEILDFTWIVVGLVVGSAIGALLAKKVQMTGMPQMVGLLNGFGGIASTLVASAEYGNISSSGSTMDVLISLILSLFIGSVTFWGSLVAFAKLQGWMRGSPITYPMQRPLNAVLLLAIIILGIFFVMDPSQWHLLLAVIAVASILGITSVIPIGGADMPVVVSLLNSYSGMAAATTGFVLSNNALIITGTLVGASGMILTSIMCKAMNRSLANVFFAGVGTDDTAGGTVTSTRRNVVRYTAQDAAVMLENAQSIIIVPGYGLAVAQAQHALQELASLLSERSVTVRYGIHPVAGRMPGHMNVLLAEANVPYDLLWEMDRINDEFQSTDVALVIGANDVINPAARHKKDSPLYGMPILNVDKAQTVMICKRSLSPGFSGEDNELFYDQKTMMIFGDAKATLTSLLQIMKE